jgi:hypothetical protein
MSSTIWKRRIALMAVVGLVVAIPVTLLVRGGDDDDASPPDSASPAPPALGPTERDGGIGVSYQVAEGWLARKESSAIRLRSRGREAEIVIASPARSSDADAVLAEAVAAIRSGYEDVDLDPGSGPKLGGLVTKGAVATVKTRDGARLRILVAVTKGERHAHLVEVFTAPDAPAELLREAQGTLNSLRFLDSGPPNVPE